MRTPLLPLLKPHFFPHFSCFQFGTGGCELWLAEHCLEFVIAVDWKRDHDRLCYTKEQYNILSLRIRLEPPDILLESLFRFPHEYFNLIILHLCPLDWAQHFDEIAARLKSSGIIVLPSMQVREYLVDYEELGEGVYRKP